MHAFTSFDLMSLPRKRLVALFQELTAPTMAEMDGEYRATLLDQGHWTHNFLTLLSFNLPGVWISKAFQPLSDDHGHGHNAFRVGHDVKRIYPMQTYLGPSRFDERPSYHLDYRDANRRNAPAWSKLAGELRRYHPGIYLGLGVANFGIGYLSRATPFILEGPCGRYPQAA